MALRGRIPRRGIDRDFSYLLFVCNRDGLNPSKLGRTMLRAIHDGAATYKGLSVQARKSDVDHTFLFARGNKTLAQAKISLETIGKLVDHRDQSDFTND